MTPQTMAVITRIFPPDRRGAAMALWGATAGVATLVGPILGGVLVDTSAGSGSSSSTCPSASSPSAGLAAGAALRDAPAPFDWLGVALSAIGMFLLVFGIQEGETYDWGTITGPDLRAGG